MILRSSRVKFLITFQSCYPHWLELFIFNNTTMHNELEYSCFYDARMMLRIDWSRLSSAIRSCRKLFFIARKSIKSWLNYSVILMFLPRLANWIHVPSYMTIVFCYVFCRRSAMRSYAIKRWEDIKQHWSIKCEIVFDKLEIKIFNDIKRDVIEIVFISFPTNEAYFLPLSQRVCVSA